MSGRAVAALASVDRIVDVELDGCEGGSVGGEAQLSVEIWSDIVCPWCYLGEARFARALAASEQRDRVGIVHRSFELQPDFPRGETTPLLDMLARRYQLSPAQAAEMEGQVAGLAAAEGLPYTSERPYGNTFDAHRVAQLAGERGRGDEVLSALFRANFSGETSVFDADGLTAVAVGAGLDSDEVRKVLDGDAYADAVRADERLAAEYGIRGVPFFLFDGRLAVSGGQPVETFAAALAQAASGR